MAAGEAPVEHLGGQVTGHAEWLANLPSLFRAERQRRGLSHRDVAEQVSYDYADLCRFEKGQKSPTLPALVRIAQWMDGARDV